MLRNKIYEVCRGNRSVLVRAVDGCAVDTILSQCGVNTKKITIKRAAPGQSRKAVHSRDAAIELRKRK